MHQYDSYCLYIGLIPVVRKLYCEPVKYLTGRQSPSGMVTIYIRFKDLERIIDVEVKIITGNIPMFLSMGDMIFNGLDTSIQHCQMELNVNGREQKMTNFFLIHMWV